MTLVPLRRVAVEHPEVSVLREPPVTLEKVAGAFAVENLDLWKDLVSRKDREELASVTHALVHRFRSSGHMGREEADSERLLKKVFLCLRLVQPVVQPFRHVLLIDDRDHPEVVAFSVSEGKLNPLDGDVWRDIGAGELQRFREVLPRFMALADAPPNHLTRAVKIFHEGYFFTSEPAVQLVVWGMGIDACLPNRHLGREAWLESLYARVPPTADIYSDLPWNLGPGTHPHLAVGDVAGELYDFRARLVHGLWDQLPAEQIRRQTMTGRELGAADVLREAACFLLRRLLIGALVSSQPIAL